MPEAFYRQFPTLKLRDVVVIDPNTPPALFKKPIIYFYTDRQNLHADVKLTFAQGAPVVWWPCAQTPVDDGTLKPGEACRTLAWSGKLTASDQTGVPGVLVLGVSPDSWLNQARIDGPAMFVTDDDARCVPLPGPPGKKHRFANEIHGFRYQAEKFIYYDGLVPATDYVRCAELTGESVTVENSAKFDIADVILIDHRDAKVARWAMVDKLVAGGKAKAELKDAGEGKPAAAIKQFGAP